MKCSPPRISTLPPRQGQPIAALDGIFRRQRRMSTLRLTVRAGGEDYTAHVALWE